jgi:hypothetical protein
MWLTLLSLACSSPPADVAKGEELDSAEPPAPLDLVGEAPPSPVALPEFSATNRDGDARTRAALVGGPTVLWFYPAAGTYG